MSSKKTNVDYLREQLQKWEEDEEWLDAVLDDHQNTISELNGLVKDAEDEKEKAEEALSEEIEGQVDLEELETPLGIFRYQMPDNLKLQGMVEDFLKELKNA